MPRQLTSSSYHRRETTSPPYYQADPPPSVGWHSAHQSLDLDELYNDSTAFLVLTTDGDETLSKLDSAFYQGNLAQTPEERRTIMREERERMRSMCFTFRADPFSHRHANPSDGTISIYPAHPHTTPPLLYSFPVDPASYSEDVPANSEPARFANTETALSEISSPPPVSDPPVNESEAANHYIFPSTALFSVSSGSASSVSSGCGRLPPLPSAPAYVKNESADWSSSASWPHIATDSRPIRERDPVYPPPLVSKLEPHNMSGSACAVNAMPSARAFQQFGASNIRLPPTQETMVPEYSFLCAGSTPHGGTTTTTSCEPPIMSQSSPHYSRQDKPIYARPEVHPAFHATPPMVSYRSWVDGPRPPRRIPDFHSTVLVPHQKTRPVVSDFPDSFIYQPLPSSRVDEGMI